MWGINTASTPLLPPPLAVSFDARKLGTEATAGEEGWARAPEESVPTECLAKRGIEGTGEYVWVCEGRALADAHDRSGAARPTRNAPVAQFLGIYTCLVGVWEVWYWTGEGTNDWQHWEAVLQLSFCVLFSTAQLVNLDILTPFSLSYRCTESVFGSAVKVCVAWFSSFHYTCYAFHGEREISEM